jgi:hypothetical protein
VSDRVWALAAEGLGLWDQCRRCFYLAAAADFPRPAEPDRLGALVRGQLLTGLRGTRTDKIADDMPAGLIDAGPHAVRSSPLTVQLPDTAHRCAIRGDVDALLTLDGATWGLADIVVGTPGEAALAAHARRLHACAHAIETPASGERKDVNALGVLAFEPNDEGGAADVTGSWRWTPIPRDDGSFFGFLAEALSVMAQPAPPGGTALCAWCVYRDASRRTGY